MMRHVAVVGLVALSAVSAMGASATDFYVSLLNRGIADYGLGRDAAAVRELKLAAFGLIDSIEHYETAQVYLTLAASRLGQETVARTAAEKVVAAEGVQRRYASLKLPQQVRTSFEALVGKLAGTESLSVLRGSTTAAPRSTPPAVTPSKPASTPPAQSAPIVPQPKPATPQQQPPVKPAPVQQTPVQPPPKLEIDPGPPQRAPEVELIPPKQTTPAPKPAPPAAKPATPAPKPTTPAPKPAPPATTTPSRVNVQTRLGDGERALRRNALPEARAIYRELLETNGLDHASLLLVAEGSYRARDFAGTVRAFDRAGALTRGEEPYRYYLAVALYETGDYRGAKRELESALPYIEVTQDVQRYRVKIEGAIAR